ISPDILSLARPTKNATLIVISDNKFNETARKFDYVQANSVLTLLDPEQMEELLLNVHKVMHKDSVFLANVPLSNKIRSRLWKRYFAYPLEWIEKVARRGGLSVEKLPRDRACMEKTDLLRMRLYTEKT
ncbi:MAG TPA: hypothetical protein VMH91_00005, partial [Candidatus Paceibacterota bacterium]|nr:hypothetical protein [Candidatus Paceibacterota bacterium]